jgi:hypothetical protein
MGAESHRAVSIAVAALVVVVVAVWRRAWGLAPLRRLALARLGRRDLDAHSIAFPERVVEARYRCLGVVHVFHVHEAEVF